MSRFGGNIDTVEGFFGGGGSFGGDPASDGDEYGDVLLDDSRALHYVMIEGLPRIWMTSIPSAWTAPTGRTFTAGLHHPGRYTQTIRTTESIADEEIPDLEIDDVDGVVTAALAVSAAGDWYAELLGGNTPYSNVLPADTQVAIKQLYGTVPSSGEGYMGLECVTYTRTVAAEGLLALTLVRGLYPCLGDSRGRMHRVDAARLQYPRIGSRATTHVGRMIAVYEVGYDTQGNVMPALTARVLWTGVLGAPSHRGNTYRFPVTSIPQYLRGGGSSIGARGALHVSPFRGQVGGTASGAAIGAWAIDDLTSLAGRRVDRMTLTYRSGATVVGTEIQVPLTEVGNPSTTAMAALTPARRLESVLNTAMQAVTEATYGIWRASISTAPGASPRDLMTITLQQGAAALAPLDPYVVFSGNSLLGWLLGFGVKDDEDGPMPTRGNISVPQWATVEIPLIENTTDWNVTATAPPVDTMVLLWGGSASMSLSLPIAPSTATGTLSTQADNPTTGLVWLLLTLGKQVFLLGGTLPASWSPASSSSLVFAMTRMSSPTGQVVQGSNVPTVALVARLGDPNPTLVEQVWIPCGTGVDTGVGDDAFGRLIDPTEFFLRALLSTGTMGYGDQTYDVNAAAWGVALPRAFVDLNSFLSLRDRSAAALARRFAFRSPTSLMEVLEEELRFLGARMIMRGGRMTIVEPVLPAVEGRTVTLDASVGEQAPTLDASNNASVERPTSNRGSSMVINVASIQVDWDLAKDRYSPQTTEIALANSLGEGGTGKIDLRSRGVTRARLGGDVALQQAMSAVVASTWARYSREAQIVTRGIAWKLRWCYPGQRVYLTEQSVPSMYTGLIGLTDASAEILRFSFDYSTRDGEVDLYLYPMARTADGGATVRDFGDSATLDVTRADKGYDAGTLTLYLVPDKANTVTGANVGFAVGDEIVVRIKDPTNPAAPQSWTVAVATRDEATGKITIDAALAGFSTAAGVVYTVEPASYSSCVSGQQANLSFLDDGDTNAITGSVSSVFGG